MADMYFDRGDVRLVIEHAKGAPATEYEVRVLWLMAARGMTVRAARIVVDAAMYGKGCIEGEVRAKIEANKKEAHTG